MDNPAIISAKVQALDAELARKEKEIQSQWNTIAKDNEQRFDAILAEHGAERCPECGGTGKLERLDAGYMRRFGLQDWTPCKRCGGGGEDFGDKSIPGRGFVPSTEVKT